MLNFEEMEKLKEIETKFKLNTFYNKETKEDIEFLLTCYNRLTWDIVNLKEKMDKMKPYEFINKICELSKEYGLSISHQDSHGAFIIEKYAEVNINWLKDVDIDLKGA